MSAVETVAFVDCDASLRLANGMHDARYAEGRMILTIVFVCLLLWFLGLMTSYTLGGILHVLLVVAVVLFLVHIIQGSMHA